MVGENGVHDENVPEHSKEEPGQQVMPFYFLCDVSESMRWHGDIGRVNNLLQALCNEISSAPTLDDVARIGLLTFSDECRVIDLSNGRNPGLALEQPTNIKLSPLSAEGTTQFGKAFRTLASTIEKDVDELARRRLKIFRSCVFFLTDGEASDSGWRQVFTDTLTYDLNTGRGMARHPIFCTMGFRDAREEDMSWLAYPPTKGKYYYSRDVDTAQVLKDMFGVILHTIVASGQSATTPSPGHIIIDPPKESTVVSGNSTYDPLYVT